MYLVYYMRVESEKISSDYEDESPSDDLKNLRESLPASMRKAYQMQCLPVYSIVAAATNSE